MSQDVYDAAMVITNEMIENDPEAKSYPDAFAELLESAIAAYADGEKDKRICALIAAGGTFARAIDRIEELEAEIQFLAGKPGVVH